MFKSFKFGFKWLRLKAYFLLVRKMENKTMSIIIAVIFTVLLVPIIAGLVNQTENVYECLNDTHPYLNTSDNLCYNGTEGGGAMTTENPFNVGFSATEFIVMSLVALILILVVVMASADAIGIKGKN